MATGTPAPSPPRRRPGGPTLLAIVAVLGLIGTVLVVGLIERATRGATGSEGSAARALPTETAVEAPARAVERPEARGVGDVALDVTLKLAAVLALAYVALAALRRYSVGGGQKRDGLLQILDSASLGPNRTIYVVKVMDKRLVVGATASQITTLAAWDLGGALADVPAGASADVAALSALGGRPR